MKGVQANQAAQVRIFGHDAIPVAIGAINPDNGITLNSGGYGFTVGQTVDLIAPASGNSAQLKVTSVGTSNIFTIQVHSSKFYVNATQAPALTLNRGETYQFYQTLSSNSTHVLAFSSTNPSGSATAYTDGVTATGTAGSTRIVTFTVPSNAPNNLWYYCTNHAGMGAAITIQDSGVDSITTGAIKTFDVNYQGGSTPFGKGYGLGDMAQSVPAAPPDASGGFNGNIASLDLPSTDQRGACLYVGSKMTSITAKMESGKSATFKGINAGSFMPILVKEITAAVPDGGGTYQDDIIALY